MSVTFDWMTLPEFLSFLEEKGVYGEEARHLIHRLLQEHRVCVKLYCDNLHGAYGTKQYDIDDPHSIWDEIKYEIIDFKNNTIVIPGNMYSSFSSKPTIIGRDIKVYRKDVEAIFQNNNKNTVSQAQSSTTTSGRPKSEWWDDLWIEVARRIYIDGWNPKTKEKVIDDMLKWLQENKGQSVSRTTIQPQMYKLFKAVWGAEN